MLVEDFGLLGQHLAAGEAVPDVSVLGHDTEHLLLTAASDQHWNLASRSRVQLGEPAFDPEQRPREVIDASARRPELVAVFEVLPLLETGSDAEDEPASADVIDGPRQVGEQVGVAVAVAGHQRADLDVGGGLGPGTQHGPALEVLPFAHLAEREEVIPVEQDVHAQFLGLGHRAADRRVVGMLGCQLHADTDSPLSLHDHRRSLSRGTHGSGKLREPNGERELTWARHGLRAGPTYDHNHESIETHPRVFAAP